jgi:phosphoglycerate dehydrogenase-like enzyme
VINADTIKLLRPGAHLVNIARGTLVDQDALRVALDDGTLVRASLDVTDPEPLPAGHWLYDHPKVFLTPHASWVGPPMFQAATDLFCANLERYLAGEPLRDIVGADGY